MNGAMRSHSSLINQPSSFQRLMANGFEEKKYGDGCWRSERSGNDTTHDKTSEAEADQLRRERRQGQALLGNAEDLAHGA
jgi:hypothetical protein